MNPSFQPLFRNPHLATLADHFWPRRLDQRTYPVGTWLFRVDAESQLLVESQRPVRTVGEAILVHGLEASSRSGYMLGMAQALLEQGFAVHRLNLRGCGGTERLCGGMYNAGLTSDLLTLIQHLRGTAGPVCLVGFSLGGNLVLKLAGELGDEGPEFLRAVCAISTPLDLAACVEALGHPENLLYHRRFLRKLKRRMEAKHAHMPERFPLDGLAAVRTLREFDERFTARLHGYRDGADYYAQCSCGQFLRAIRVPTLLIQAQNDPLIPFRVFEEARVRDNPCLELVAPAYGGHLGFLSRRPPRFWDAAVASQWLRGSAPSRSRLG